MSLIFPDLITLNQYGNSFSDYIKIVYSVFEDHFIKSKPRYNGQIVSAQAQPAVDNMHKTFYHITHEGEIETNRTPDLRRMERISYLKFMIISCPHKELLVWEKTIGRDNRIHILNEEESYLTVLTERRGYFILWTSFYIERSHTLRKKINEYEEYIKTKTAEANS